MFGELNDTCSLFVCCLHTSIEDRFRTRSLIFPGTSLCPEARNLCELGIVAVLGVSCALFKLSEFFFDPSVRAAANDSDQKNENNGENNHNNGFKLTVSAQLGVNGIVKWILFRCKLQSIARFTTVHLIAKTIVRRIARHASESSVIEELASRAEWHQVDLGLRRRLKHEIVVALSDVNLMPNGRIYDGWHLEKRIFITPDDISFGILLHLDHIDSLASANK